MPTYDYKCSGCGEEFEYFHSISDNPIKKCPVCGKNKVVRLISGGSGFILKGSGFYKNDYKNKSNGSGFKELTNEQKDTVEMVRKKEDRIKKKIKLGNK